MVCRPGRHPSAENRSGKRAVTLSLSRGDGAVGCVDGSMVSTRRSRSRSWHVRIPRGRWRILSDDIEGDVEGQVAVEAGNSDDADGSDVFSSKCDESGRCRL